MTKKVLSLIAGIVGLSIIAATVSAWGGLSHDAIAKSAAKEGAPPEIPKNCNCYLSGASGPDIFYAPGNENKVVAKLIHTPEYGRSIYLLSNTDVERAFALGWITHIADDPFMHGVNNSGESPGYLPDHGIPLGGWEEKVTEFGIDVLTFWERNGNGDLYPWLVPVDLVKDAYDSIKNDTHPNITTDQIKYGSYILAAWGKSEEVWISTHPEHYPVFKGLFGDYESYFDDASEAANHAIWNPTTFRWPTVSLQNSGTTASEVSLKKREQYNKDIIRLLKNKSIVVPHRYDDEKGILYIYEPVIDDREAVLGVMDRYFGQINEPMINK